MKPRCKKCGCYVLGIQGSLVDDGGVCITCREEPAYGCRLRDAEKLKLLATAERASHPENGSIHCMAPDCTNWASEWWYFCSPECRDVYNTANP